jgi:hypothetical protein
MSYSNYVLNQRLSNIEYQLQHGGTSSTLEQVLTNGNDANNLSILNLDNLQVSTINGSAPTFGADVYLAGGTSSLPQTFTGYNQFDEIPICSVDYITNPPASDNLITKGYADATYATLDLDNAFTAVNTFTAPSNNATPVLIEGAGSSNPTLALIKQATDYSMFFLTDAGDGSYGSIVNAGDNVIVSTQGDIDTGVLDLMTHTNSIAGIKITSTGEQISGTITGYIERGGGGVIPLQFTSGQTSGDNPIADFVPIVPTNSKLSVIADPTIAFSHQTTAGDMVVCATTSTGGGSMELCSHDGASMRITPSGIYMISSSTYYNNFELLPSLPTSGPTNRGLILSWNESAGNGETDFLNCAEGGSGGFSFYNGNATTAPSLIAKILPTIALTDNSTTLSTTAYVKSNLLNYAPLASPALTGTPSAPTPATSDSSTTIATTAYVNNKITSIVPQTYVYSVSTTSAKLFNFTWTGGSYTTGNMIITGEFSVFYIDGATGLSYNTCATFSTGLRLTSTFPLGPEFSVVLQPTNMYNTTFIPSIINVFIGNTAGVPYINIQYPLSATTLTGQLTCQAVISNTFPTGSVPPTPVLSFD